MANKSVRHSRRRRAPWVSWGAALCRTGSRWCGKAANSQTGMPRIGVELLIRTKGWGEGRHYGNDGVFIYHLFEVNSWAHGRHGRAYPRRGPATENTLSSSASRDQQRACKQDEYDPGMVPRKQNTHKRLTRKHRQKEGAPVLPRMLLLQVEGILSLRLRLTMVARACFSRKLNASYEG